MSEYFDLGGHTRTISTDSAEAQLWFDRGLNWTYAFNHEEAVRCFAKAAEADPTCPMPLWGMAYAQGPNYNLPLFLYWKKFPEPLVRQTVADTYATTQQALALLDNATPAEQALIKALAARYQAPEPPTDFDELAGWDDAYADAMREVYRDFGDDLDVASLFAEAMMNRTPWLMWDLNTGQPAENADTVEATEVLERALNNPASRTHPGVLHLYVHLMEMSPHPEKALRAGDWLRGLVPDGGHLNHMPTHIDVLCGHYQDVVTWNHEAIISDRKFVEREGVMNIYTMYRTHNYHFKLYGAMFQGQYEAAMDAAEEMVRYIPEELLRVETLPMADLLESFLPMNMHVLIRFGKWQEIIDAPLPEDQELYCVTTAMTHYAKGVAYSATGQVERAQEQKALFEAAVGRVPDTRYLHNNASLDLLAVAAEMLNGELEYRKGNYEVAYAHLRKAIDLEDALPYDEPWGWMQPTRHAYGALLLEQGHVEEAEAAYRADLGFDGTLGRAFQHPENVWALHGYHECLMRLGKHDEARMIKQRLDLAVARADVPIKASCACRMSVAA
jgi:tetratricopeptide (TPR) repeat protein